MKPERNLKVHGPMGKFRCTQCKCEWEDDAGATTCPKCRSIWGIEWVNWQDFVEATAIKKAGE